MAWALLIEDCLAYLLSEYNIIIMTVGDFGQDFHSRSIPRGCVIMMEADTSMAVQNTQRQTSSLPSRYPATSKRETEPQCHHQLQVPIPHCIANAGRQGFKRRKVCHTSTNVVVR